MVVPKTLKELDVLHRELEILFHGVYIAREHYFPKTISARDSLDMPNSDSTAIEAADLIRDTSSRFPRSAPDPRQRHSSSTRGFWSASSLYVRKGLRQRNSNPNRLPSCGRTHPSGSSKAYVLVSPLCHKERRWDGPLLLVRWLIFRRSIINSFSD